MLIPVAPTVVERPAPPKLEPLAGLSASIDPLEFIDFRWGREQVGIALTRGLERDTVERALREAHLAHRGVELFGAEAPRAAAPRSPLFAALTDAMIPRIRVLPLDVLLLDEVCDDCVGSATLEGDALLVTRGAETDHWREVHLVAKGDAPARLDFVWTGGLPELIKAAQLALSNDHLLAVRVAR